MPFLRDLHFLIYNQLSWTGDTKHGKIISDEQAINEVKAEVLKQLEETFSEWKKTSKV